MSLVPRKASRPPWYDRIKNGESTYNVQIKFVILSVDMIESCSFLVSQQGKPSHFSNASYPEL